MGILCHWIPRIEGFGVIFPPFEAPQRSTYGPGSQNLGILCPFPLEQRQIKAQIIYRQKKPIEHNVSLDSQDRGFWGHFSPL